MTDNWTHYPHSGGGTRSICCFFQGQNASMAGYGVVSGCIVTRSSATQVAISSGEYSNAHIATSYAGGTIGTIAAATSGNHRYDIIYIDASDGVAKRAAGTEGVPSDDETYFLENGVPQPPDLPNENSIMLAIICVTDAGIRATNNGTPVYSVEGVADMRFKTRGSILLSQLKATSEARGDIIFRGASEWQRLAVGLSGKYVRSQGASQDLIWDNLLISSLSIDSQARGDTIMRGSSAWGRLAPGTANKYLMSNGTGADLSYELLKITSLYHASEAQGCLPTKGATTWDVLAPDTDGKVLTCHGAGSNLTWENPNVNYPPERNHAWNSSFEFMCGSAVLGWAKFTSTATIIQDTGERDGYGGSYAIKITSGGSGNEGAKQTLKDLKASTVYTVIVRVKATTDDTARVFTTGGASDLNMTSTSTSWTTISGTFTTNSTPTDIVLNLGSSTSGDIVWFDKLMVIEGTTALPSYYMKDKEWDSPIQLAFSKGDGSSVIPTGQLYQPIQAYDNFEIVGWSISSDLSTTSNFDVWKKSSFPPGNGDSLGGTKPSLSAAQTNTGIPIDWTSSEISKGDWLEAEIEANSASKNLNLFLMVRRR